MSPSATPAPAASPSPTPSAAVDPAQPATWTIGFTSIGPVSIGQTRDEALASTALPNAPLEGCPAPISVVDLGDGVELRLTDDVLAQIVLFDNGVNQAGTSAADAASLPRTAEGLTVGSTADEVTAAYPDAQTSQSNNSTVYSVGDGAGHWINFQAMDGVVVQVVVRDKPSVYGEYCG